MENFGIKNIAHNAREKGFTNEKERLALANFLVQARFAFMEEVTPRQIAKMLGLKSANSVDAWEEGNNLPSEELLPKIAEIYKVSFDELRANWETSKHARNIENGVRNEKYGKSDPLNGYGVSSGYKKNARNGSYKNE